MADTSLGEGIGLQSQGRSDFWNAKTAELGQQNIARKAKERADLIKLDDIKVDYNQYPPAWGKRAAEVTRQYIEDLSKYQQDDPRTAHNKAQLRMIQAKQDLAAIKYGADRAIEYAKNDKIRKNPELASKIFDTNATMDDITKLADGNYVYADPNGGFNFNPVPVYTPDIKYGEHEFSRSQTGKRKIVGNVGYNEYKDVIPDAVVQQKAIELAGKDAYVRNVAYDNPEAFKPLQGESPEQYKARTLDFVHNAALVDANRMKPSDRFTFDNGHTIPQGSSSSSGSGKDNEPESLLDKVEYGTSLTILDPITKKPVETKTAARINMGNKNIQPLTISNSRDIFEVESNDLINKGKPTNFQFKPDNFEYKVITKGGKKERKWYVSGVGVDIAGAAEGTPTLPRLDGESNESYLTRYNAWKQTLPASEKPGTKKTTFNMMVPLDLVSGQLKKYYKLNELNQIEDEVNKKYGKYGSNQSQAPAKEEVKTTVNYNIKGKDYSEDELIKMGYTTDQIAPFKKK